MADHLFVISEDSNLRTTLLTIAVIAFSGANWTASFRDATVPIGGVLTILTIRFGCVGEVR